MIPSTPATSKRSRTCAFGIGLSLLGGVLVVVGSALPWIGIGGVNRSAFTLARVANELHVFERKSQRFAVYTLLTTPVLVPLGLFLVSVGWHRSSAFALFIVGVVGLAAGGVGVWASIGHGLGPIVTVIGGGSALIGSCVVALFARTRNSATGPAHA